MKLWDYIDQTWRVTPRYVDTASGRIDSQAWAEKERWNDLANEFIYEELIMPGDAPLGYNDPVVEVDGGRQFASLYPAGTEGDRSDATRQALAEQIETQRQNGEQRQVDLARDPGVRVLMDEVNAAAEARAYQLDLTSDADLGEFDTTLDLAEIGAVATAMSLVTQESRALAEDASLDATERADVEAAIAAHQAIVDAGDDAADVPAVPTCVRADVGVVGEDYGTMIARRLFSGGWWWLTFELRTERELDTGDYWIAVYDGAGTYLTTPQLTQTSEGVYEAGSSAVNLPKTSTDDVFEFTLCFQHISNEQFKRKRILAGQEVVRHRARWAGKAGQ